MAPTKQLVLLFQVVSNPSEKVSYLSENSSNTGNVVFSRKREASPELATPTKPRKHKIP
jgi:hypothetical protein